MKRVWSPTRFSFQCVRVWVARWWKTHHHHIPTEWNRKRQSRTYTCNWIQTHSTHSNLFIKTFIKQNQNNQIYEWALARTRFVNQWVDVVNQDKCRKYSFRCNKFSARKEIVEMLYRSIPVKSICKVNIRKDPGSWKERSQNATRKKKHFFVQFSILYWFVFIFHSLSYILNLLTNNTSTSSYTEIYILFVSFLKRWERENTYIFNVLIWML